jgi:leucyl aminopeptidase
LTIAAADLRSVDTPIALTGAGPGAGLPGLASPELLAALGFSGAEGDLVRLPAAALQGPVRSEVLAVVGLGQDPGPDALRRAAGAALRQLGGQRLGRVGLAFEAAAAEPALAAALAEGALLGADDAAQMVFACPAGAAPAGLEPALDRARKLAEAVRAARDLVNQPPNELYPEALAAAAAAGAKQAGLEVEVLDQAQLAAGGYGGLVAVGQGSIHPPRLVSLRYSPPGAKRHLALVGKGITFDSGGLSLKSRASMVAMKSDMAGAAAVLQAVLAAAALKVAVKVSAFLCLAENLPSGGAVRPGDVIAQKGGRTVEVADTDAEGRLVLADGIVAAREAGADEVVDIATLTGAQITALGKRMAGVMGTPQVRQGLVRAAARAGEAVWAMPLPEDLLDGLKSDVADLASVNLSDGSAGMLVAGLFLREFAGSAPWGHIDMAGPAYNRGEPHGFTPKGATGFGVATLLAYLEAQAAPTP